MRIDEILKKDTVTLSCEVFPPKKFEDITAAQNTAAGIARLKPAFMSVTYGAAGTTPGYTLALAESIRRENITPLCHLTCVQSSREHVRTVLHEMKKAGMENVLALRGDIPQGGRLCHDFEHASDLIAFIKSEGDFCIGAACYPEMHPECASRSEDIVYLKRKVDTGVDFLTTQMFFDNSLFYNFMMRALRAGINVPVCAGIMPICDPRQVRRAVQLSGSIMPPRFAAIADRFCHDPVAMQQAGIAYATEQIIDLIANGVNHIHLYTMNKSSTAQAIMNNLSGIIGTGA